MKFRKKPVVIEAMQFTGTFPNYDKISEWSNNTIHANTSCEPNTMAVAKIFIPTLEGEMCADLGDWIIRGVKGEFYPCKPDIFEQTYEKVE